MSGSDKHILKTTDCAVSTSVLSLASWSALFLSCGSTVALARNPLANLLQCPQGWTLNDRATLCVNGEQAISTYTDHMIDDCVRFGGGDDACRKPIWSRQLAEELRGKSLCPSGTRFDAQRAVCTGNGNAYGPFSRATVQTCVDFQGGTTCTNEMRFHLSMVPPKNTSVFCPDGFSLDPVLSLCSGDEWVVGPFPEKMKNLCRAAGLNFCDEALWPRASVLRWKTDAKCYPGAGFDESLGLCRDGDSVFGPFTVKDVEKCVEYGGDFGCLTNRWHRGLLAERPSGDLAPLSESAQRYRSFGSAYYPDPSPLEGGYNDSRGNPLRTLQDFLAGKVDYVSVAMDDTVFRWGTRLRIPELEQRYKAELKRIGRNKIVFKVVDTGEAFIGMGTSRIDVCVRSYQDSLSYDINRSLTLVLE